MTDPFDEDLEAIFEERAAGFSKDLRDRLRQLWRQGVLEGRALERACPALDLEGSRYDPNLRALVVPMEAPLVTVKNGFFTWKQLAQGDNREDSYVSWFGSTNGLRFRDEIDLYGQARAPKDLLEPAPPNSMIDKNQDAWIEGFHEELRNVTESLYSATFLKEYNNEWAQKLELNLPSSTVPSKKGT